MRKIRKRQVEKETQEGRKRERGADREEKDF